MSDIRRVTLLMIDGGNDVELSAKTIKHCSKMLSWGGVRLFSYKKPDLDLGLNVEWHLIPYLSWPEGAYAFQTGVLPFLVDTEYMLYMQPDGYITHPELWDGDWLNYDIVAPPWPLKHYVNHKTGKIPTVEDYKKHMFGRVGSGGFCLKSKKFLRAASDLSKYYRGVYAWDVEQAVLFRDVMQTVYNIKFAPLEVALKFGIEHPIEEFPDWKDEQSFGFHEVFVERNRRFVE